MDRQRRSSRQNRSFRLSAAGATAAAISWMALAPAPGRAAEMVQSVPATAGGVLHHGLTAGEPPSLDPLFGLHMSGTQVWSAVYEQLFTSDLAGELTPKLAEGLELSDDALTITVTLPSDVTFHDGEPFDADAVIAHYERAMASEDSYCNSSVATIESLSAPDPLTIVFEMTEPSPEFPSLVLAGFCGFIPAPEAAAGEDLMRNPVGTGPFQFVSWTPGSEIVVERFDGYRVPERPFLDEVVFGFGGDTQTQIQATHSGELDVTVLHGYEAGVLDAAGDLDVHSIPLPGQHAIRLNSQRAPFDSREVRCAALAATDTELLSRVAYEEVLPPVGTSGITRADSPVRGELDWPGFDPALAATLLAEAGGQVAPVELLTVSSDQSAAELVQQMWAAVGLNVTIRVVDPTEHSTRVLDEDNFQAAMHNVNAGATPQRLAELFETGGRSNFGSYSNPDVDALIAEARQLPGLDERITVFQDVYDILVEDCPHIPTVESNHFAISHAGFHPVITADPSGAKKLDFAESWLESGG